MPGSLVLLEGGVCAWGLAVLRVQQHQFPHSFSDQNGTWEGTYGYFVAMRKGVPDGHQFCFVRTVVHAVWWHLHTASAAAYVVSHLLGVFRKYIGWVL
jgi:hypothetical protein